MSNASSLAIKLLSALAVGGLIFIMKETNSRPYHQDAAQPVSAWPH